MMALALHLRYVPALLILLTLPIGATLFEGRCSSQLQEVYAPEKRNNYPLIIGIFSQEDGAAPQHASTGSDSPATRRSAIRSTWKAQATKAGIPSFFVLSGWKASSVDKEENAQHQDMVFLPDRDGRAWGPNGLSVKLYLLLHFAGSQCASFRYLLKADDSSYLHIPRLQSLLEELPLSFARVGSILKGTSVKVTRYTSDTGLSKYPLFLQGGGYMLTSDVVQAIAKLGKVVPLKHYGKLDDVVAGTWMAGWNLKTIPMNASQYVDLSEGCHGVCTTALCMEQWLVVHPITATSFQSYRQKMCPNLVP